MIRSLSIPLVMAGLLTACGTPGANDPAEARISALPPVVHPADNPYSPAKAELGKLLFVDPRLSGSGKMACQSCHVRDLGWTDGRRFSRKDDGSLNSRHTPSLYNVGYQTAWYWDGRAATLEAQVLAAWRGQIGADPAAVVAKLDSVPGYRDRFRDVFGEAATPENVAQALATYFRTLVSDDSPWDRYEKGERDAVSRAAIAGQQLFMGKGRCAACHTPPYYGNSTFYNIGLEHGKDAPDPGRFNVTRRAEDAGAFKTPSLRSVALGAPYFHDASAATLKDAVRYMAGGGNADPNKTPLLVPTGLTEGEIDELVAFLESLTSSEPWQAPRLP